MEKNTPTLTQMIIFAYLRLKLRVNEYIFVAILFILKRYQWHLKA